MYTNSTISPKKVYAHTKVDKTNGDQFAALSEPNKNLKSSQLTPSDKLKYDALYTVFRYNETMQENTV